MGHKALTHNEVAALPSPERNRVEIFDNVEKGLGVRVTPTGSKSFFYRYRMGSKTRRFKIGDFPAVSLSEARKQARRLKLDVQDGNDPQSERDIKKMALSEEPTFNELCDRFIKRHLPTLRQSTKNEYTRIIQNELAPKFGKFRAKEVGKRQILDLLDAIGIDRGKKTLSNRVRAVLSSIYSFGVTRDIVEVNPVLNIKRKKNETKRDRVYSPEEINRLWGSFEEQAEPVQSIYKILLLCGQRSSETRRMRWEDIDFNKEIWRIPEEETKAKRSHIVPLSKEAFKLITNLKPLTKGCQYVFQSPKGGDRPVRWLHKATNRIQITSEVSDFRIHDLRRTMASYLAELGTDRTVLGKVLNHKGLAGDDQVTAIYDRYDYLEEKGRALNLWSRKLIELVSEDGKDYSNIIKLG